MRTATWQRLAARPALMAALLFLAGVTLTSVPVARFGAPLPVIHDEFSYLFLGQTLAKGRLTNDPPPGPPAFFQTFHILLAPRYVSKFPPGQGMALALGIWLGQPIFGVWIVDGWWAMALYWMLRGTAPPGWALLGAVVGVAGYGAFSYWGQSYWGGNVQALGGTLAFGGALRLWRGRGRATRAALGAGAGCAVMALTRPLDGAIFALLPALVVVWASWRGARGRGARAGAARVLAFGVTAALGVALMLAYNVATTGRAGLFAHQLYDETQVPGLVYFVWEKPPAAPPPVPDYILNYEKLYSNTLAANPLTWRLQLNNALGFAGSLGAFLFPLWTCPLLLAGVLGGGLARDRAARLALGSLAGLLIPLAIVRYYDFPHYAAAWTAPALVLMTQGARRWRAGGRARDGRWWRVPAWLVALGFAAWPGLSLADAFQRGYIDWMTHQWVIDRHNVESRLTERARATGRPQLVAIAYPAARSPHPEWVYNTPDPAAQPVLWARSLGPARDPELFAAFPGYDHWILQTAPDGSEVPDGLQPWPPPAPPP